MTPVPLGASDPPVSQTFQSATAGVFTLTGSVASVSNSTAPGTPTLTGGTTTTVTVYNLAAANTVSTPINLGTVHVGGTFGTQALAIQNTAPGGYSENLDVTMTAGGQATAVGSISGLAPQSSDTSSLVVGLSGGSTPGTVSGTVTLNLQSDGAGNSGLGLSSLGTQTISVSGSVYSGKAQWNVAGPGNWSSNGNWTDAQGNGATGAPGVSGFAGDTATFGNAVGNSSPTITLERPGGRPHAITFSNTGAGVYTLSGSGSNTLTLNNSGSGAMVAVADGINVIDAPVVLTDNLVVGGSGMLAFGNSSSITDNELGYSLTMNGIGGTLILSGSGNYTGGTNVTAGELEVTSSDALPVGGSLTVGANATSIFSDSLQAGSRNRRHASGAGTGHAGAARRGGLRRRRLSMPAVATEETVACGCWCMFFHAYRPYWANTVSNA